jgi:hypothetical protein
MTYLPSFSLSGKPGLVHALADVGLDGDEAALDIRDLRSKLDLLRPFCGAVHENYGSLAAGCWPRDWPPSLRLSPAQGVA